MAQKNITVPGVPAVKRVTAHVQQPSAHPQPVQQVLTQGRTINATRAAQSPIYGAGVNDLDGAGNCDFMGNESK